MKRVGLITYARWPDLYAGDRLLLDELVRRGLVVEPLVWDDPAVEWSGYDLCVIRSTWDYYLRQPEFAAWVMCAADQTELWNPADVVIWNTHKTYLRDLAERGIPTVPTEFLPARHRVDLAALLQEKGWADIVIKPTVSADAFETDLFGSETLERGQATLERLLAERDVMVQPFLPSVHTYGERSLLYIDGVFTHAVLRQPPDWQAPESAKGGAYPSLAGSQTRIVQPDSAEMDLAEQVMRVVGEGTLYARVDIVRDQSGASMLLELELVEPSLFLEYSPHAVAALADAIVRRLS